MIRHNLEQFETRWESYKGQGKWIKDILSSSKQFGEMWGRKFIHDNEEQYKFIFSIQNNSLL